MRKKFSTMAALMLSVSMIILPVQAENENSTSTNSLSASSTAQSTTNQSTTSNQSSTTNQSTTRNQDSTKDQESTKNQDPVPTEYKMTTDAQISVSDDTYILVSDSMNQEDMNNNSEHLQQLVEAVSAAGGGTIHVPEGKFYMTPTYKRWTDDSVSESEKGWVVICCKDNVEIDGAGQDQTVFYPYNQDEYPTDMFGYIDRGSWDDPNYLENCDFSDFTVDGSYATGTYYNAKGKGFYMAPVKDCDWTNITVRFTDGTGFGMDEPINCTITNCNAIGCGKGADIELLRNRAQSGASGFGIGFGYSEKECILIKNCKAYGNFYYGFFTENQARFCRQKSDGTPVFTAKTFEGFHFVGCVAGGNTYNFGGELASYTIYEDCEMMGNTNDLNPLQIANVKNYNFTDSDDIWIIKNGKDVTQDEVND